MRGDVFCVGNRTVFCDNYPPGAALLFVSTGSPLLRIFGKIDTLKKRCERVGEAAKKSK